MTHISYPAEKLDPYLERADSSTLDAEAYRHLGAMVVRQAIPADVVEGWFALWREFYAEKLSAGRALNPYNPVVLNEAVPEPLAYIYRHPALLDLMEGVYPELGIYLQRFVIKDVQNRAPVFLHQDYPYNLGWPDKTSVFIPLTPMNPENGGLTLYPGTHLLGYLSDAGELDVSVLAPDWPRITPSCEPGDVVLMHDCTWHESGPRRSDEERILIQATYQPATDPSCYESLRGSQKPIVTLEGIPRAQLFKRTRSSRLRELQEIVDRLQADSEA